ncbi:MAG: PEP-CTERM sorting domain-containing protein [Candidatus Nealsonbacteria bacterium]|nr:PEP-CTERM sorting domain-containing protein [Candidatus Nealsonbacteria bacterium]
MLSVQSTACAQTWANVDVILHSTYQAVNADGSSAYPPGDFPVRLVGVVINNSEDWLNPAANYMEGPMWAMGGEAEIYVQTVDPADFGGTAAWMGQNYGNHFWHFPDNWDYNYSDPQWYAELDRLHLYRPNTPYGDSELVRAGDLIELRVRGGLNYKGKQNVNEQHDNDPRFDFEIVILQKDFGLPSARPITLEKLRDVADADVFDPTRATGGEQYQSTRAVLRNVGFRDFDVADWHSNTVPDLILEDATTTRSFPIHLGPNESFDVEDAPEGPFDVVGVMDQKSSSTSQSVDGYRMLAMNVADFHEVSHWASTAGPNWNTGSNWDRGSVPGNGSSLIFDGATTLLASSNDLAGRELFGLAFVERDGWQIGGNMLTIGGYIVAENNASIDVDLSLSANQAWDVAETKTLTVSGQVSGDANLLKTGAGTVNLTGDLTLGGNATIEQGTVNVGNHVTVGVRNLHNAGTISVGNGELAFGSGATCNAGVSLGDGSAIEADTIVISAEGSIHLNGTLAPKGVGRTDAGFFESSTLLTVVDNSAKGRLDGVAGDTPYEFATVDPVPAVGESAHIGQGAFLRDVTYHRDQLVTTAVELDVFVALGGDADGDGKVWLSDWGLLRANFGNTGAGKTWTDGNFDPWVDDKVWLSDWGLLRANFGNADYTAAEAAAAVVPEPGTMALVLAAWGTALLVGWRRRRRVGGRP